MWCSNPHPSLLVRKIKIKKAHGRSNQAILIWVLKIGSIMNHPIKRPLGVNVSGRLDYKYAIVWIGRSLKHWCNAFCELKFECPLN